MEVSGGFRHALVVDDDLQRLADRVIARRNELGMLTAKALAQGLGMSTRLLGDIENARRRVSPGTYARLEGVLRWGHGSVRAILAGGEPTVSARSTGGDRVESAALSTEDMAAIVEAVAAMPDRPGSTLDDVRDRLDAVIHDAIWARRMLDRLADAVP